MGGGSGLVSRRQRIGNHPISIPTPGGLLDRTRAGPVGGGPPHAAGIIKSLTVELAALQEAAKDARPGRRPAPPPPSPRDGRPSPLPSHGGVHQPPNHKFHGGQKSSAKRVVFAAQFLPVNPSLGAASGDLSTLAIPDLESYLRSRIGSGALPTPLLPLPRGLRRPACGRTGSVAPACVTVGPSLEFPPHHRHAPLSGLCLPSGLCRWGDFSPFFLSPKLVLRL